MFEAYVGAGFDPAAFWHLTPRAYWHHMRGAQQRAERERQALAWAVWHLAVLGRAKKIPSFDEFVAPSVSAKPAKQTPEEVAMRLKMVVAAWGGKVG